MLKLADRPIEDAIRVLATLGVEAAYLVPTATGLEKSILDAHQSLRDYFKSSGIHDFTAQKQGDAGKKIVPCLISDGVNLVNAKASLYRPETKSGDPRIWFYGLKALAKPGNLLAILVKGGQLHALNLSDPRTFSALRDPKTPVGQAVNTAALIVSEPVSDLLGKLTDIGARGYVTSLKTGDTGVGYTLETMLGIDANANRGPDYRGIEIKASRVKKSGRDSNRVNLFSQVPDWKNSHLKSGLQILKHHGYVDTATQRRQLYCTVGEKPNSQGLYLMVDGVKGRVDNLCDKPTPAQPVVCWSLGKLHEHLLEKHRQTFWVKAKHKRDGEGREEFHFVEVEHTQGPFLANFAPLVEIGAITMDYLLHEEKTTGGRVKSRDHGYLFKIKPQNLDLLFPPSKWYPLF